MTTSRLGTLLMTRTRSGEPAPGLLLHRPDRPASAGFDDERTIDRIAHRRYVGQQNHSAGVLQWKAGDLSHRTRQKRSTVSRSRTIRRMSAGVAEG